MAHLTDTKKDELKEVIARRCTTMQDQEKRDIGLLGIKDLAMTVYKNAQTLLASGDRLARLHQQIEWLNFSVPGTRSLPGFPGIITLTSPQRHTVYLWVAVHLWVFHPCENLDVKKLLDDGVYVEKAFPRDLFPALNSSEALYLDAETRDYRGYSPSGQPAELNWSQILEEKLSDSLKLSDELVEFLENEDESQEGSFDGEELYENDES